MSKNTQHTKHYNSDDEVDDIDNSAGEKDGADTLKPPTKVCAHTPHARVRVYD